MVRRTVAQERLDFQLEETGDTITGRAGCDFSEQRAPRRAPPPNPGTEDACRSQSSALEAGLPVVARAASEDLG
jgi:hypothetical protein